MLRKELHERCGTCRFWDGSKDLRWATCLRLPPAILPEREDPEFPITREDWWCGEWKDDRNVYS